MPTATTPLHPDPVTAVRAALAHVRAAHGVHIPLAVESGSRAWGFPSPDSDYDARFIFVRAAEQHLTPWPGRDVIELPIEGLLDVSGWELGKAVKLVLKGNAVVLEWLRSPIVYAVEPWFRDELLGFARAFSDPRLIARHYLHLGLRQYRTYLEGAEEVALKKLFYAVRPAAALRWLRAHPGEAVAPMPLAQLLTESGAPAPVVDATAELIALKAVTREMGTGPVPAPLLDLIRAEFEAAEGWSLGGTALVSAEARAEAVALYRRCVLRLDAERG